MGNYLGCVAFWCDRIWRRGSWRVGDLDVWTYGGNGKPSDWSLDTLRDYCTAHFEEARKLDLARTDADEVGVGQRAKIVDSGEMGTVIAIEHAELYDDLMFYVDLDNREGEYTAE